MNSQKVSELRELICHPSRGQDGVEASQGD